MAELIESDLRKAFTYLESGPAVLVSSCDSNDHRMTISWQIVRNFTPHIAILRGACNETFATILETKECVINIPAVDLIDEVITMGTTHSSEINKFDLCHLTKQKAKYVRAPLISDCVAAVECQLEAYIEKRGLLILSGMTLWENPDPYETRLFHANGDGTFFSDGDFYYKCDEMSMWVPEGSERFFKK